MLAKDATILSLWALALFTSSLNTEAATATATATALTTSPTCPAYVVLVTNFNNWENY